MFVTRFSRYDGGKEDYLYHTKEEAEKHLFLFQNDDSGLYRNIAVIDDTNTVKTILPFENGKPTPSIREGDMVRLKAEYCSPGERKYIFAVTNLNEATGRTNIMCLNSSMTLKPIETVGIEMIRPVPAQ